MMSKNGARECGPLRLSYDEMPAMPLGIALRSGRVERADSETVEEEVLSESSKRNESVDSQQNTNATKKIWVW
jgi:hypothetical protein